MNAVFWSGVLFVLIVGGGYWWFFVRQPKSDPSLTKYPNSGGKPTVNPPGKQK